MTRKELLEIIDSWENLSLLLKEINKNKQQFELLVDIALRNPEPKSWRAAYLVDKVHDDFPELILPYLDAMIETLKTEKNLSKKRHFLKLISMNGIPEQHEGFLFDFCLKTLASEEPTAVRVHAMQILYNISESQPGLKHEILAQIEHEMEYRSTAGILSRGKKIARKLHRQIH